MPLKISAIIGCVFSSVTQKGRHGQTAELTLATFISAVSDSPTLVLSDKTCSTRCPL